MADSFQDFERVARSALRLSYREDLPAETEHPFENRNIHPTLPAVVKSLFDNGHYSQATFEAFKFLDKEVARLTNNSESGFKLMMAVLSDACPQLRLTPCSTISEKDEQKGYQFLFAGSMLAIRNPRGHEYSLTESPDECLDHLGLASLLLRRLQSSGHKIS